MNRWLLILSLVLTSPPLLAADSAAPLIDRELARHFAANQIVPAPSADDAEFLRRASLDLVGRIPAPDEIRSFLSDPAPDKRDRLIDRLLASPDHAAHFANVWRALLLPEAETDRQLQYFVPGFEEWLRRERKSQAGFDVMVRELLAAPITGTPDRPQLVLKDLRAPNPLAFIASKDADPAKIAATSTRLFLGIRLECAECHAHPFAQWSQEQFWNQAAFFAGVQRKGRGPFAPILEDVERRTIAMMSGQTQVSAEFLDGTAPPLPAHETSRIALAAWMTSPDNPYFAKAIVNRVWGELLGTGITDPVDDMDPANPPVLPELLDGLARGFAESGFDLTWLYRSICTSAAYQRTSRLTAPSQADPRHFARMAVKPLSGDQFFDSLAQAVTYKTDSDPLKVGREQDPIRRGFLELFSTPETRSDPETSVAQALTLMNGRFINQAASPKSGAMLQALLEDSALSDGERIERLYLATVSRFPTETERQTLQAVLTKEGEAERPQRLGDVLWMLLNSPEFRWNH